MTSEQGEFVWANRLKAAAWVVLLLGAIAVNIAVFSDHGSARLYPKRVPVYMWHPYSGDQIESVEKDVQVYNRSQSRFELIALSVPPSVLESKFTLSVLSGNAPDLLVHWQPIVPKWAEDGIISPIDQFMTPEEWKRYRATVIPIAAKIGMMNGHLYGCVPYLNCFGLYYRIDHLKEAGLDPDHLPQTLEEVVEWGRRLDKYDSKGNLTRIGFMPSGWHMYAPSFGGGFYDWNKGKVVVDTPQNLETLKFLNGPRERLGRSKVVRFESGVGTEGDFADWTLATGAHSIVLDGMWKVYQSNEYTPWLKYRISPIPPAKGGKRLAGFANTSVMVIPTGAKHPEGAWHYMKYQSGFGQKLPPTDMVQRGALPAFLEIIKTPGFRSFVKRNRDYEVFVELLKSPNLEPVPPVPYQNYFFDKMSHYSELATRGLITPRQAVQRLESIVRRQETLRKAKKYDR